MEWWQAVVLGVVQGLTEFLPISSSGHLVLAERILGIERSGNVTFEVVVHLGTLGSVVWYYSADLALLAREAGRMALRPGSIAQAWRGDGESGRLLLLLALATVPAGLVGVCLEDVIERHFHDPRIALVGLIATGVVLVATRFARPSGSGGVGARDAAAIGIAQAIAILPGVSRSGSTIAAGLFCGRSRVEVARFSFLLSIPVILGAAVLQGAKVAANPPGAGDLGVLALGAAVSFVFGVAAIRFLLALLGRGRLEWFGVYCLVVGGGGLLLDTF